MDGFIVLKRLQVQNANAITGLTWGFPGITNFLGFAHALERKLASDFQIKLPKVAVVCHSSEAQAHRSSFYRPAVFSLTRNPLTKEGKTASFVEEGRMHMTVSLVIAAEGAEVLNVCQAELTQTLTELIPGLRLAGGTIIDMESIAIETLGTDLDLQSRSIIKTLLPGFALVARPEALGELKNQFPGFDDIDAWLEASALRYAAGEPDSEGKSDWALVEKSISGWIVPIAVGFRAISKLFAPGEVNRTRDPETPFRFVENVYSIGEWLNPLRANLNELFWHYQVSECQQWYLAKNAYQPNTDI